MMVMVSLAFISERFWLVPACEPSTLLAAFLERFQSACLLTQQLPAMKPEQLKSMVRSLVHIPEINKPDLIMELTGQIMNKCKLYMQTYLAILEHRVLRWSHAISVSCLFAVFDRRCHQCSTAADRGRTKKEGRDSMFWAFGCAGGCMHCFSLWLGGKVRSNPRLPLIVVVN